ncbi:hypothetical protein NDU88_003118 [Pleurodeles waltl]|uniref:Uncharacterized protein n=1 Tax=Pleurodeles waltl TaxID=8319 RepID=A0AAV7NKI8_PLEWA|nr:hypothetical protein NDU88_003118 [Pleurodeles waltl]
MAARSGRVIRALLAGHHLLAKYWRPCSRLDTRFGCAGVPRVSGVGRHPARGSGQPRRAALLCAPRESRREGKGLPPLAGPHRRGRRRALEQPHWTAAKSLFISTRSSSAPQPARIEIRGALELLDQLAHPSLRGARPCARVAVSWQPILAAAPHVVSTSLGRERWSRLTVRGRAASFFFGSASALLTTPIRVMGTDGQ